MRKIIILVSLLFIAVSCKTQEIKKNTVEYFNIERYKDWEVDTYFSPSEDTKFFKKGNERVEINFFDSWIRVSRSDITNPYDSIKGFSNTTKRLIGQRLNFYQFGIRINKQYDDNGKVVKEIDNDKPYLFSLEQLIEKVKKEYNVDLEEKVSGTWA